MANVSKKPLFPEKDDLWLYYAHIFETKELAERKRNRLSEIKLGFLNLKLRRKLVEFSSRKIGSVRFFPTNECKVECVNMVFSLWFKIRNYHRIDSEN